MSVAHHLHTARTEEGQDHKNLGVQQSTWKGDLIFSNLKIKSELISGTLNLNEKLMMLIFLLTYFPLLKIIQGLNL